MENNTYNQFRAERQEYDLLLNTGFKFKINQVVKKKEKRKKKIGPVFISFFKTIQTIEEKEFIIKEPVLKVLDRLSYEYLELDNSFNLNEANKLSLIDLHSKTGILAKIIAIAVLGIEFQNEKKLKEYTDLFSSSIPPSKLLDLIMMINTMSNLGDFYSSIGLIVKNRTANPNLIEQNN